jgi:hypothetical protein
VAKGDHKVVPVKMRAGEWGFVILDDLGKVISRGYPGTLLKSSAKRLGEEQVKHMRKNQRRIEKAAKKIRKRS